MAFNVYRDMRLGLWFVAWKHNGLISGPFKSRETAYQYAADYQDAREAESYRDAMVSQFMEEGS